MVALVTVFATLLFLHSSWATPLYAHSRRSGLGEFMNVDPRRLVCQIFFVSQILCPGGGSSSLTVQTPLGVAQGTLDPDGAKRFVVKYASAQRWQPSTLVTSWNLPTGTPNVTALPLACPQPSVDPALYTEDCLSMILYVPTNLNLVSNVPTLMWIHGGSFFAGSATGPGLDGSKLATATNSIVAVVQYRLGALGFMGPGGDTNFAVKDTIKAMQFLKLVVPSFGGSSSKITLAGQSSGANMIRALLATPSATSLFRSAIVQSDPMNFGFLGVPTQQALQSNFNTLVNCGASDTSCQNGLSLSSILAAQTTLINNAPTIDPSAGSAQPIRPVRDGTLITTPLDSTANFPSVTKPLLVSSVMHEAGPAIFTSFVNPVAGSYLQPICEATFGPSRTNTVLTSSHYTGTIANAGPTDTRGVLQDIGTDYMWKCSSWTFARNWVQNGGQAYVGLYTVGATYPGNNAIPFCTQPGSVCHQDDIQIVFGTVPNPTPVQAAMIVEVQKRYKAFLSSGNPNAPGLSSWPAATTTNVNALNIGGSAGIPVGACDPAFWGQSVEYDYQVFGI